jgi:hypothetical protein
MASVRWRRSQEVTPRRRQAILINIKLADDAFGESRERPALWDLEDELIRVLDATDAGDYDGNEVGEGLFTIHVYGRDADELVETVLPIIRRYPLPSGSSIVKRYGAPGAREDRLEL